jgi:hypothetical protein
MENNKNKKIKKILPALQKFRQENSSGSGPPVMK